MVPKGSRVAEMAIVEAIGEREYSKALVHQMARGDCDAAKEFYESHCDQLLRFVVRRVNGSVEDAEEIANDVFLAALDLGHSYDGSTAPFSWLCSLARNKIVDFRRRIRATKRIPVERLVRIDDESKRIVREVHDPSVSIEQLVEQIDRVRLVQKLLESLTHEQREAVTMRYVEGFSISEIAQVMKRSEKSVEKLLERAKERPRREVIRWLGDEGFRMVCLELLVL